MKKLTLVLVMALMGLAGFAQADSARVRIGYLSYDSVMVSLAQYADMQEQMSQLRSHYDAEMKRVEDDFNKKYEAFLDGQASFPKTILQKRQSELQEILDKNIAFKRESQQLLAQAEAGLKDKIVAAIHEAVGKIASERGYIVVINTDAGAAPWLSRELADDITDDVKAALQDDK